MKIYAYPILTVNFIVKKNSAVRNNGETTGELQLNHQTHILIVCLVKEHITLINNSNKLTTRILSNIRMYVILTEYIVDSSETYLFFYHAVIDIRVL